MNDREHSENTRLAVYGSLAPGRVNHHQLAALQREWQSGTVQGILTDAGWGAALGFLGLKLDPAGGSVKVALFVSGNLPDHWAHLDEFEGPGSRRVVPNVRLPDGEVKAQIYMVA